MRRLGGQALTGLIAGALEYEKVVYCTSHTKVQYEEQPYR
jgi:hypothetical protein